MADLKKFICNKCRYKFTFKSDSTAKLKCPYCGGTSLWEDNFSVQRVLKEVSDE
jgi:DNA-directed RNA polymerase subunit RPC12/RpoP